MVTIIFFIGMWSTKVKTINSVGTVPVEWNLLALERQKEKKKRKLPRETEKQQHLNIFCISQPPIIIFCKVSSWLKEIIEKFVKQNKMFSFFFLIIVFFLFSFQFASTLYDFLYEEDHIPIRKPMLPFQFSEIFKL